MTERAQWLEDRRKGIGGSDVAAICGLNPWRSPMAVYLDKLGQLPPTDENEAMHWGNLLEPLVAKEFEIRTGWRVQRRNQILQHPERPFMLANIDRLIYAPRGTGVLEIKTTNQFKESEWRDDHAPDVAVLQLQHYLAVTGREYGYLAVLIGGQAYRHVLVERNDDLIETLIAVETDFWRRVQEQDPPEWSGSDSDQELLSALYPESRQEVLQLPKEAEVWLEDYTRAKGDVETSEFQARRALAKIKAQMGEADTAVIGSTRITWRADCNGVRRFRVWR